MTWANLLKSWILHDAKSSFILFKCMSTSLYYHQFCGTYFIISVKFQLLTLEMVVLQVLRDFAGGTSIHGFTFLVRPTSSRLTKVIWAIAIVIALMYASAEMRNSVISKYHYNLRTNNYYKINLLKFESPFLSILSIFNDNDFLIMKSIPEPVPMPEPSTYYISFGLVFSLFYQTGISWFVFLIRMQRRHTLQSLRQVI